MRIDLSPDPHDNVFIVWCHSHTVYAISMTYKFLDLLSCCHVPDSNRLVLWSTHNVLTVWCHSPTHHSTRMTNFSKWFSLKRDGSTQGEMALVTFLAWRATVLLRYKVFATFFCDWEFMENSARVAQYYTHTPATATCAGRLHGKWRCWTCWHPCSCSICLEKPLKGFVDAPEGLVILCRSSQRTKLCGKKHCFTIVGIYSLRVLLSSQHLSLIL